MSTTVPVAMLASWSIPPDAQGFVADRMGATTETMAGSHAAFVAHPVAVAEFIGRAVK